jgi:hypothetical protein
VSAQLDIWKLPMIRRIQSHYLEHSTRGLGRTYRQPPALQTGDRVELGASLADRHEDPPRVVHEQLSTLSDTHSPAGTLEQARAKLRLQSPDLMAERRLHHIAALGGTSETERLGDRNHVFQLTKIHRASRYRSLDRCSSTMIAEIGHGITAIQSPDWCEPCGHK